MDKKELDLAQIPYVPAKNFRNIWAYATTALTGSLMFGFAISALNPTKSIITADFGWCRHDGLDEPSPGDGSVSGCWDGKIYGMLATNGVFVGAALVCFFAGGITKIGRRFSLIVMHIIFFSGALMSALADGYYSLTLARIVAGMGLGSASFTVPLYLAEMSPKYRRGYFGVLHQVLIATGVMLGIVIGLPLQSVPATWGQAEAEFNASNAGGVFDRNVSVVPAFTRAWWRVSLAVPCVVSAIGFFLLTLWATTETPHMLMLQGDYANAAGLLRRIYNKEDVSQEVGEIKGAIETAKSMESSTMTLWQGLSTPVYRNVIWIGVVLSIFQQTTGVNVFMANSNKLFSQMPAIGGKGLSTVVSSMLSLSKLILTVPAMWIVERFGRRPLMLAGTMLQFLSLLFMIIPYYVTSQPPEGDVTAADNVYYGLAIFSTFAFICSFAIAYGPVFWIFLFEVYPIEVKKSACAFASGMNWIGALIIVVPSDFLLDTNPDIMFDICAACCLFSFFFVFLFQKETKGRSIDNSPYFKAGTRNVRPKTAV